MKKHLLSLIAVVSLMALPAVANATTYSSGDSLAPVEVKTGDAWFAGSTVSLTTPVDGELFAAGRQVTATGSVSRSAFIVGDGVTLAGAGYNAFVAGNTVRLSGTYGNNVYVAGNDVVIAEGTVIGGDLYIGAATATIHGEVKGYIRAQVAELTSNATVGQSLTGSIEKLTFTGGTIARDVSIKGSDPKIVGQDTVKVGGAVSTEVVAKSDTGMSWSFIVNSLLMGIIVVLFWLWRFPKTSDTLLDAVRENHGKMFGTGLLVLLVAPLALLILAITVVGMKLAALLFFVYAAALIIAGVQGVVVLSSQITKRLPSAPTSIYAIPTIVGLALALLGIIPGVGALVGMIFFFVYLVPSLGSIYTAFSKKA